MNKSDIKKIYYNGNEITSLYWGGNLIYQKQTDIPVYNPKRFAGKFTDDSVESDWKCKLNGVNYVLPVDPETKEFDFEYEGNLTNLSKCFYNGKIEKLYHFPDTSNVTNMGYMFSGCNKLTELNLNSFDTSNVTNMWYMFDGCNKLTELNLTNFDTSNVTNICYMFRHCNKLTELNLNSFDISKVISLEMAFAYCGELTELKIKNFDVSNSVTMNSTFYFCDCLTNVIGQINGIKINLDLGSSPLTNDSAMVFINGLANVGNTKTIKFKSTTFNTLTEEQIAIATSKGWSVVSA